MFITEQQNLAGLSNEFFAALDFSSYNAGNMADFMDTTRAFCGL